MGYLVEFVIYLCEVVSILQFKAPIKTLNNSNNSSSEYTGTVQSADSSLSYPSSHILQLQKSIGNRAVAQLIKSHLESAKLLQRQPNKFQHKIIQRKWNQVAESPIHVFDTLRGGLQWFYDERDDTMAFQIAKRSTMEEWASKYDSVSGQYDMESKTKQGVWKTYEFWIAQSEMWGPDIDGEMESKMKSEDNENFAFKQKEILGEEACYGLSLAWIRKRAEKGEMGSHDIQAMTADSPLADTAKKLQSAYITNSRGEGPILDSLNKNMRVLKAEYGLARGPESGREVGKHLSNEAVWEKQALAAARKWQHANMENKESGLVPRSGLESINFKKTEFEGKLRGVLGFLTAVPFKFYIIVLDGIKGGHAMAVEKEKDSFYLFDPDASQSKGGIDIIDSRIKAINLLLDLHSIEVESFQ
jgi:hypothetical protein